MGRVACERADRVIVTSDNPRSESPEAIIGDVIAGCTDDVEIEVDRRAAIGRAFAGALPGDVVVIAGKGHETTQTIGSSVFEFSDAVVAAELLAEMGWTPA
jgi:UDP-N-acetylmuramoyl-L-alanyl-D-glutamate--2,6-diaminopimelate ligase